MNNIEEKVEKLLEKMSLKEKIGQMNLVGINAEKDLKEKIRRGEIGSLILANTPLSGESESEKFILEQLDELQRIAVEESPNKIPLLYGKDVIHGYGVILPMPLAAAASFNPELVEKGYRFVAQSAAANGIHQTYAPMIDLARDPRWGRVVEGFGEDPYLGAKMAVAVVRGFQGKDTSAKESVAACAKHYIGYGAAEGGRDYYNAEITDYTLRNFYLPAFRAASDAGVKTVMSAFHTIGGQPVTSSKYLINDLLKKEVGFEGFVVSDWGTVEQLKLQGTAENDREACRLAANAGLDMDMSSVIYAKELEKLVNDGVVSEETVDNAVRRILKVKMECGLFDKPFERPSLPDKTAYLEAACELAEESMVLLKNRNNALPIKKGKKIAILGPMTTEVRSFLGTWTIDYDMSCCEDYVQSFKEEFGEENVSGAECRLLDEQRYCAHNADVIVLALGESHSVTGEGNNVAELEIDEAQKQLLKFAYSTGKPVVVLMNCGRPMAMRSIEPWADAVLYVWHCGTQTAKAAAKILSGKVAPSGRLPMTFPAVTGQVPVYYNSQHPAREYASGYYNDKMTFNYRDIEGMYLYPFGYGLSYTEFEYSGIRTNTETIDYKELKNGKKLILSVDIKNIGKYDGKETAQCYIRDPYAEMARPMRELKGFKKIFLAAGETKTVEFELGFEELGYYNGEGIFDVEPGEFHIFAGKNCTECDMVKVYVGKEE